MMKVKRGQADACSSVVVAIAIYVQCVALLCRRRQQFQKKTKSAFYSLASRFSNEFVEIALGAPPAFILLTNCKLMTFNPPWKI